MIEKFPELNVNYPDKKWSGVLQALGGGHQSPSPLRFMIDELLKNAMDASVMNTTQTSGSQQFNIKIKVKIKKQQTDCGNKFIVKISDNGGGFSQLSQGQKKNIPKCFLKRIFF